VRPTGSGGIERISTATETETVGLKFSINDKCTACMACVRVCPVEAVSISGSDVAIVEDTCIECGLCVPSCYHDAIDVVGDEERCRDVLDRGRAALILPTEAVVFFYPATPEQLINACFDAGFERIYFESVGDELVAGEYLHLWRERDGRSWIRSTSPIVVNYCRTKLPELLPFLAPVVTPAVALARYIRTLERAAVPAGPRSLPVTPSGAGDDAGIQIVYAGVGAPGVNGDSSAIDMCISLMELESILHEEGIPPLDQPLTLRRMPPERRRHLSLPGGLPLQMLDEQRQSSRKFKRVRGLFGLPAVARAVIGNETPLGFVDVLPFEGGLGHPAYGPPEDLFWRRTIADLVEPSRSDEPVLEPIEVDLSMHYEPREDVLSDVDPDEVGRILERIGTTPDGKHWNTGSCGHGTCVEFATAVARGRSSMALCPIYLARQYEQAMRDAIHDGLTGVFSYRVLDERLREELSRASRTGTSLAVLFVDLDRFKPVNDTYGHGVGNEVLRGVASVLKDATRSTDIVCRYGGDEFVVILVNPDREGADRVAEQIRSGVEAFKIATPDGRQAGVTVSIGVAYHSGVTQANVTGEELMAEADAALYVAKAQGGNTIHPTVGGELVR
jgi:diguanylate cyclase (GGDEF)-like protein